MLCSEGALAADRESTEHVSSHATRTWHMFANQQQDCEKTQDFPVAYFAAAGCIHLGAKLSMASKLQRSRGFHVGFQLA